MLAGWWKWLRQHHSAHDLTVQGVAVIGVVSLTCAARPLASRHKAPAPLMS